MNDWVILASLILVAATITVCVFVYLREDKSETSSDDDHDDILGI